MARLARLILSEEEIAAMQQDLTSVLSHIERIGELDLAEVLPTSHVVDVTGALRADDPQRCLPRERALESAPAVLDDGFLVPSPQA